jgi:hypothetical protein
MLDLSRYLLGVAEIALLGGFAGLGASALRGRLLPSFSGAPACLSTGVIALALLIWVAEILGSFGLFEPVPYLVVMALVGSGLWLGMGGRRGCPPRSLGFSPGGLVALAIAAVALIKFGLDVRSKLGTGMTGFDSTWYHGPFAAGFFQSGNTWDLHFIAPQFLAWFYPANAEIFHTVGVLAFGRDVLSPLLNLGWFMGCLLACWCIGRPYRVAPWSLALGAVALSLPVLSDQAGEARNDIVGTFFLLAAVAIALNARSIDAAGQSSSGQGPSPSSEPVVAGRRVDRGTGARGEMGPLIVSGLAAGLAAGTKLNFLLPAVVLVLGLALIAPAGKRWRALAFAGLAALAGGGYWYLRNLIHTGNPLPWFDHVGPISLPAPEQALGGREGHSVLGYLTDSSIWSDWFLPGLHSGLTILWPLLGALALAGLVLCFLPSSRDRVLMVAGLTGFAVIAAWLIAPTSASGPEGMPRGFESGLRYLAPALVLGLALLPATPPLRGILRRWRTDTAAGREGSRTDRLPLRSLLVSLSATKGERSARSGSPRRFLLLGAGLAVIAIAIGYPVQRHYLRNRYATPTFAAPGLNAAFKWANGVSGARIATTSTRQYPLYGADLSNHVQYIGEEQPHGGFTPPTTCPQWRRLLNAGHYDYVVTTRDRIEPGKPPYPASTRWTEGLGVEEILRKPPTVVFKLKGPLDPVACRE